MRRELWQQKTLLVPTDRLRFALVSNQGQQRDVGRHQSDEVVSCARPSASSPWRFLAAHDLPAQHRDRQLSVLIAIGAIMLLAGTAVLPHFPKGFGSSA